MLGALPISLAAVSRSGTLDVLSCRSRRLFAHSRGEREGEIVAFLLRVRGAFLGAFTGGIGYPLAGWFCFGFFYAIVRLVYGACGVGWRNGGR